MKGKRSMNTQKDAAAVSLGRRAGIARADNALTAVGNSSQGCAIEPLHVLVIL